MKTRIKIIAFFVGFSLFLTNAQEKNNSLNFFIQGGRINNGYNMSLGVEKLLENQNNSLIISLNSQKTNSYVKFADNSQKEFNYFFDFGYRKYFFTDINKKWKTYGEIGVLCGYQHLSDEYSGIFGLPEKNRFLYGANFKTGIEYSFGRFSPYVQGAYSYMRDHYLRANIGLKINL